MSYFSGKEILITGGTGSLGSTIVKKLLANKNIKGIRIFSRDEFKQYNLRNELTKEFNSDIPLAFLIGDVRDEKRLTLAARGADIIINTAAMKQVPACEDNPIEAVNTNINGAISVINAAIKNNVKKVLHISTDKAVYPVNLYGATKTVAEKLFLNANVYAPNTQFSCCRYGNVLASRGSIIPYIQSMRATGRIPLTHPAMSRFFIHLPKVAEFILNRLTDMQGEEIFVPIMYSLYIKDLISVLAPECVMDEVGIRDGEKLSETLITLEESEYCNVDSDRYFTITKHRTNNAPFTYNSTDNPLLIKTQDQIISFLGDEYVK